MEAKIKRGKGKSSTCTQLRILRQPNQTAQLSSQIEHPYGYGCGTNLLLYSPTHTQTNYSFLCLATKKGSPPLQVQFHPLAWLLLIVNLLESKY